ncbi:MAG: OmpH family outer membrane protein [Chitinophagaceae bacterium]|nr:OmpH family outer membrane protein [Chitinophagaceae bacterium]MBK8951976.1 OmpH family outer membrane protein [Chitinophagaceae bacterium]
MRKFISLIVLAAGMLFAGNTNAQVKIGLVNIDDVVSYMVSQLPQKINLDTVGQQYVKDSVLPTLEYKQSQYNEKLADLSDTTKKLSDQVKKLMFQEMQQLQQELSGADQAIQQVYQYKQNEFLAPFYEKAQKAIENVAKKKGYSHVMAPDVFRVAPENDNISLAVLTELGLKLPEQPKPAAPATKPAANTPAKTGTK